MGAPPASTDAPLLVVVRASTALTDRTVEAIGAARRRHDRVVVARPPGAMGVPRRPSGHRFVAEDVTDDQVVRLASEHVERTGGAVVLLHDGAHGFGTRWLADLAGALAHCDAALVATNGAPWPSCPLDLPDERANRTSWRDFTRAGASRPVVPVDDAAEHVGPALALSPRAVQVLAATPVEPPLEVSEISRSVAASGLTVGRAEGVYVHDEHASVLVSACLIMRDEVENLERCLHSLRGVVDEIVIYDTGSVDDSVAVARSLGATVVTGSWHDDFSLARNAARRACRGTWLFHIDADEEIEDTNRARDVRKILARDLPVDLLAVPLHNLAGTELAPVRNPTPHWVPRLLHRTRCHWTGALHEHPMPVSGQGAPRTVRDEHMTLVHYGYLDEVVERRDKRARNARIAAGRHDEGTDAGRAHFDHARTHVMNGENEAALPEYAAAADVATNPIHRRCALEQGALVLLNLGRLDEADAWIDRRAAIAEAPGVARWLRARAALLRGDAERVLAELDGITDYTDNFSTNGPDTVHLMRADALVALGRVDEAGGQLLDALAVDPAQDQAWVRVLRWAEQWPDVVTRAARTVPASQLKLLAAKLLQVPAPLAALAADALWDAHPNAPALLALAVELGPSLAIEPATTWAVRLRAAGHDNHCPLRAIARAADADPVRRLQAAFAGAELFGDVELLAMVDELAALFPTA